MPNRTSKDSQQLLSEKFAEFLHNSNQAELDQVSNKQSNLALRHLALKKGGNQFGSMEMQQR